MNLRPIPKARGAMVLRWRTGPEPGLSIWNSSNSIPTAFCYPGAPRFLITEAARGEGAKLVDANGRPFMQKYDKRGGLATRDIVARSIYREMLATAAPNVYLDLKSYIPKEKIIDRFPMIRERLLCYGIDIVRGFGSRSAGGALFVRRCLCQRRDRGNNHKKSLRGGRGCLQWFARRESFGKRVAFGRVGLG